MKHAIVTGATGFIGAHLVAELIANGVEVTALCRRESPALNRLPPQVRIVYDAEELPHADVFYHLAWEQASGPGRVDAVLQSRNVGLTLDAISAAHRLSEKIVVLGTVYENFYQQIVKSNRFSGSGFYILAKKSAHDMGSQLAYKLGIDFVWCKICHPFGEFVKPEQMLASVLRNLLDGKTVEFGPGTDYYDIVAVEDLARGLCLLGECKLREREYYIGSGKPRLLKDYLSAARECLGVKADVEFGARPDSGLRFEREWFDIALIARDTGYGAETDFEQMVKGAAGWLESST